MIDEVVTNETTITRVSLRTSHRINHRVITIISSGGRRKNSAGPANGRRRINNVVSSGNNNARGKGSSRISNERNSNANLSSAASRTNSSAEPKSTVANKKMAAVWIKNG